MLKLCGALCILAACVIAGWQRAQALEQRRRWLQGAHQGLLALMREIDYAADPMPQALAAAAELAGPAGDLFRRAAEYLRDSSGCTAGEAWLQALADSRPLAEDDRRLLAMAAEGLGVSDAANQLKALELLRLRLERAELDAAGKAAQLGKIWKALGWGGGAVLVLLLL